MDIDLTHESADLDAISLPAMVAPHKIGPMPPHPDLSEQLIDLSEDMVASTDISLPGLERITETPIDQ